MGISRQHPFISPIGCGSAIIVILGVMITTWLTGGEQFNPGDLSAQTRPGAAVTAGTAKSHADFEMDCRQCHVPFRGINAARCEECHTSVGEQRATHSGLHGNDKLGNTARCQDCHSEHRGRDTDLLADARKQFDHGLTIFSLKPYHVRDYAQQALQTQCETCHTGSSFAVEMSSCTLCHGAKDQVFMLDHTQAFGTGCLNCHDGLDKMHGFDHGQTKFPLKALHASVACAQCHKAEVPPAETPTDCAACHAEPRSHAGMFGTDCAACHTPAGWSPATLDSSAFDHASTGFALTSHTKDYDGTDFTCRKCHTGTVDFTQKSAFRFDQQRCIDCHTQANATFMGQHTQDFGLDCLSCHDGSGNMKNFDHAKFFVLDGQHAALACDRCHLQKKFKGTSKECVSCHAEPQIHAGIFGTDCAACHTTTAWTPARLTQHTFPLNHGEQQGEVACATCHPSNYTSYTCYGCHEHVEAQIVSKHAEENIRGEKLKDCVACHATGQKEGGEGGDH